MGGFVARGGTVRVGSAVIIENALNALSVGDKNWGVAKWEGWVCTINISAAPEKNRVSFF